jgi:hypothetical protein
MLALARVPLHKMAIHQLAVRFVAGVQILLLEYQRLHVHIQQCDLSS